jgi:hypothetical protein
MDPTETLKQIRRLVRRISAHADRDEYADEVPPAVLQAWCDDAQVLAGLAEALDEWITGGGFLPEGWTR